MKFIYLICVASSLLAGFASSTTLSSAKTPGIEQKEASSKSCRALALSGGGALGAFEAGVLWGLVKNDEDKTKYEYDVITGVSAGSFNALFIAAREIGQEETMVEYLSNEWEKITTPDVFIDWTFGIANGLINESGLFNNSPLFSLL